jgi:stringent starvation protein B
MDANPVVSTKPYLIRAIYEWCVDQGFTPHVAAAVDAQTRVPMAYVRDGQIVLNVGPEATHQLVMDNEQIAFQARFNGVVHHIVVPIGNVAAIYARENGQGMAFEIAEVEVGEGDEASGAAVVTDRPTSVQPPDDDTPPPASPPSSPLPTRGGHLKVVK